MTFQGQRHLLLLGAGHAHVHVLTQLAQHRPPQLSVTVVTPYPHQTYSGMTPGFVAGRYTEEECQISLSPLIEAAGARWEQGRCSGINAAAQSVQVMRTDATDASPITLDYDLLSVDTGAVIDHSKLQADIPGAPEQALIVRPIEAFAQQWPKMLELARQRPLSVVVVGAGAAGVELVFAAEECIRTQGVRGSRFTLVTGGDEVAANYPPGVQTRVLRQLQRRGITVLRDSCTGIAPDHVLLGCGATLTCDVSIVAIGTHAPPWLQGSGLDLSESGHLQVNAYQQSTSHAKVFAAGDVASRADNPHPRSGVYAVRAGPPLAHNLLAALDGKPLLAHQPPKQTLNLLSCGTRYAIASFGAWHAAGRWAWIWKDRIDRGFVARYKR